MLAVFGQISTAITEILYQHIPVGCTALRIAQRVELKLGISPHTEFVEDRGTQRNHFDITNGFGNAKQLHTNLVKLTQAPLLRAFVSEHRPGIKELQRQVLAETAGDKRTGDSRRPLGPQRDLISALVGEGIHFLGDDIRRFTKRTREHVAEFENRRCRLVITIARGQIPAGIDYMPGTTCLIREDVVGAANGLKRRHI